MTPPHENLSQEFWRVWLIQPTNNDRAERVKQSIEADEKHYAATSIGHKDAGQETGGSKYRPTAPQNRG